MTSREIEHTFWNCVSEQYKSTIVTPFIDEVTQAAFYTTLSTLDNDTPVDSILELGCGNGYLIPRLAKLGGNVTCIDFAIEMVKNAQEVARTLDNVVVAEEDAIDLPYESNSFDSVYAINSLIETERMIRLHAFANVHRVLKEGGHLYAMLPSNESVQAQAFFRKEELVADGYHENTALHQVYEELNTTRQYDPIGGAMSIPNPDNPGSFVYRIKLYSREELAHTLAQVGFKNIHIEKFVYPTQSEQGGIATGGCLFDWMIRAQK